jgi:hypothetical protein
MFSKQYLDASPRSVIGSDPGLFADSHAPDTGGRSGDIPTGLGQLRASWSSSPPGAPPPVGTECSCTADIRSTALRSCYCCAH